MATLCPERSHPLALSRLFSLSPQLRKCSHLCLSPHSSCCSLDTPAGSWCRCRAHLFCFPSLKTHCPLLSDIHYIETQSFICFVHFFFFLVVSPRRVNLVLTTLPWVGVEVPFRKLLFIARGRNVVQMGPKLYVQHLCSRVCWFCSIIS